jgi:hypothetical protein
MGRAVSDLAPVASAAGPEAPAVLRLHPDDDVLISARVLRAGEAVDVDGVTVTITDDVPTGFKLAARALAAGQLVHRLGVPIGRTTAAVPVGGLVHVHNLASQYLRTHERGEA